MGGRMGVWGEGGGACVDMIIWEKTKRKAAMSLEF